jgi:hypothetical protein
MSILAGATGQMTPNFAICRNCRSCIVVHRYHTADGQHIENHSWGHQQDKDANPTWANTSREIWQSRDGLFFGCELAGCAMKEPYCRFALEHIVDQGVPT